MARFHSMAVADADVLAWVLGIARHRAAERSRAAERLRAAELARHDEHTGPAVHQLLHPATATAA